MMMMMMMIIIIMIMIMIIMIMITMIMIIIIIIITSPNSPMRAGLSIDCWPHIHLSADRDKEKKPAATHKYPGICLTTNENPGKPQLGDRLMKASRPVIDLNEVPYLQMSSVESHSTSGREMEGN